MQTLSTLDMLMTNSFTIQSLAEHLTCGVSRQARCTFEPFAIQLFSAFCQLFVNYPPQNNQKYPPFVWNGATHMHGSCVVEAPVVTELFVVGPMAVVAVVWFSVKDVERF